MLEKCKKIGCRKKTRHIVLRKLLEKFKSDNTLVSKLEPFTSDYCLRHCMVPIAFSGFAKPVPVLYKL